ncbi:MAG: DUF2269 family protein [Candidatus Saccharimonadales bacterium]
MTDMMVMSQSVFELALVIHIAGALILFGAYAVDLFETLSLRLARSAGQVRFMLGISRYLPIVFHTAAGMIIVSGFYMGYQDWSHQETIGWIVVALVLFLAIGLYGAKSAQRTTVVIEEALRASGNKMTQELRWAIRRPEPVRQLGFSTFSVIGILVVMIFQPSVAVSILVLALAIIFGVTAAQLLIGRSRNTKSASLPEVDEPADMA